MAMSGALRAKRHRDAMADRTINLVITSAARDRLNYLVNASGMSRADIISTLLESYDFKLVDDNEPVEFFEKNEVCDGITSN